MAGASEPVDVSTKQQRIAGHEGRNEEPCALIARARICGGPGWATTQAYPANTVLRIRMGRDQGRGRCLVALA